MKAYDFSIDQQRQLFVNIRINYLRTVQHHLSIPAFRSALNDSDLFLINLACQETGIMADRMCTRLERLSSRKSESTVAHSTDHSSKTIDTDVEILHFMQNVHAQCENIKQLLSVLLPGNTYTETYSTETTAVTTSATAPLLPFPGFDLLWDESDRSLKRGHKTSGTTPVYLNLLLPELLSQERKEKKNEDNSSISPPTVLNPVQGSFTLAEHVTLFTWCQETCDAIRSRGNVAAANTVQHQLVAFVEHVFLTFLDCPTDFCYDYYTSTSCGDSSEDDDENSNKTQAEQPLKVSAMCTPSTVWRVDGVISYPHQRQALSALSGISQHYTAAAMSLLSSVEGGERGGELRATLV